MAFDADDTLWDFTSAMRRGLISASEVVDLADLDLSNPITTEELVEAFDRRYLEHLANPGPGKHISTVRTGSFDDVLLARGVPEPQRQKVVEAMTRAYFDKRHGTIDLFPEVAEVLDGLRQRYVIGLITNGNTDVDKGGLGAHFDFRLAADDIGIRKPDPRIFEMAAAAAGCRLRDLVYVGDNLEKDVAAPQAVGAKGVWIDRDPTNREERLIEHGVTPDAIIESLSELSAALTRFEELDAIAAKQVGVGPHPQPWPNDDRLDGRLLAEGDRRNVVDRYRYWSEAAIVADLDRSRHGVHVAVENWQHDLNIGTVVRNANAFNVAGVHIVGQRRWNRRGAMATDRYLHVHHHPSVEAFRQWADAQELVIVGVDNVDGSVDLDSSPLPASCVLAFGQEGPGLSDEMIAACSEIRAIGQYGSTRSLNASVASGIVLHAWAKDHAPEAPTWP